MSDSNTNMYVYTYSSENKYTKMYLVSILNWYA